MDEADLDDWCRGKNKEIIQFHDVNPARLSDYRLTFNYYSTSRRGGAANIMPSKGSYVYGLLIKINANDLCTIRSKEGCPNKYSEINIEVELLDGTRVKNVKSYKVVKSMEKKGHQKPTRKYLNLIIKNAKKYNFPLEYISFLESFESV